MDLRRMWADEVRPRVIVATVIVVVATALAMPLRGSIHLGAPPPFDPPRSQAYEVHVTLWHANSSAMAGWVRSHVYVDCPSLVLWVESNGRAGYIGVGPVRAGEVAGWSGWLQDVHGGRVPVSSAPVPTASCQ